MIAIDRSVLVAEVDVDWIGATFEALVNNGDSVRIVATIGRSQALKSIPTLNILDKQF